MTYSKAKQLWITHICQPHGDFYTDVVSVFQEGFLNDNVSANPEDAFIRAVDAAERLIPVIKIKAI